MKLSEYENEEALDILADIIEPAVAILGDKKIKEMFEANANNLSFVTYIIRNHKKEIIEIMARMDGIPVSEYKCNIFTLPKKVLEIVNDQELMSFFAKSATE